MVYFWLSNEYLSYVVRSDLREELYTAVKLRYTIIGEQEHRSAHMFLQKRVDKGYSLCDAVSFIIMADRGLTEALTTDHHFE